LYLGGINRPGSKHKTVLLHLTGERKKEKKRKKK
jgi:hypothetical protein